MPYKHSSISPRTAMIDLAWIIGILLISKSLLLRVDPIWAFAGPISLILTWCVATWRLGRSNEGWSAHGVKRPKSIARLLLQTLVALVLTMGVGIIAESLAVSLIGAPSESTQAIDARFQGRFDNLPGNLPVFIFWLAIAWVVGGFVEEMLFRGVLFSRFEQLLAKVPLAAIMAVLLQAALFGQQHYYYQGAAGWIATGAIAAVSAALYIAFKRNLWPLILSHGLSNTIGLTLLYLGFIG